MATISHQQLVAEQQRDDLRRNAFEVVEAFAQLLVADERLIEHCASEVYSALGDLSRCLERQEQDHTHAGLWPHRETFIEMVR